MPTPVAFHGAIFDVDGVLVDSPDALAWQDALRDLMEGEWQGIRAQTSYSPERFTLTVYQHVLAGKPVLAGARAVLDYFGYRTPAGSLSAMQRPSGST